MSKFRNALCRFMYGRNGVDALSWALVVLEVVLSLLSAFIHVRDLVDAEGERHSRRAGPPRRQGAQIRPLLLRRILPRAARRGQD